MKKPKNLTLSESTLQKAESLVRELDVDNLSGLVALLVREEWEQRQTGAGPVSYLARIEDKPVRSK